MPTITTVDATWTNGMAMDEAELRRADTAMLLGDGSANGVRGGVVRHGDTSLAVAVNGSDQVTVQAGAAVIPAAAGLGAYRASLSAATTATGLAARNATNPRIDLVVIQIVSGAAVVKTVEGTPSSSPSAPALPATSIELARLTVPALGGGAVTVDSTWRSYATGLGGKLLVETAARLPGSGNQKGQEATALDTGFDHRWDGTTWVSSAPTAWTAYSPSIAGFTTQAGSWFRWKLDGTTMKVQASTKIATVGATFVVPVPASMGPYMGSITEDRAVGVWHALDVGTARFSGAVIASATDLRFAINGVPQLVGTTTPFTWAAGDPFSFEVSYERA